MRGRVEGTSRETSPLISAELAYLFDFTLGERPLTREQEKLADQMMRYWGAFAHTGNPDFKGAPEWNQYGDDELVMSLQTGGNSVMISDLQEQHNCDFWLG